MNRVPGGSTAVPGMSPVSHAASHTAAGPGTSAQWLRPEADTPRRAGTASGVTDRFERVPRELTGSTTMIRDAARRAAAATTTSLAPAQLTAGVSLPATRLEDDFSAILRPLSAPSPTQQVRAEQARLDTALMRATEARERLVSVVEDANRQRLQAWFGDSAADRPQELSAGDISARADRMAARTADDEAGGPSLRQVLGAEGAEDPYLDEGSRAALRDAFDDYVEARAAANEQGTVYHATATEHVEHVEQIGMENLERVREFYASHGVDVEAEHPLRVRLHEEGYNGAQYRGGRDSALLRFGERKDGTPKGMSEDTMAHEYTHYVLWKGFDVGSGPHTESGAIHESLGDTIAAAMDDDWTYGEESSPGGVRDFDRPDVTISDFNDERSGHAGSAVPSAAAYRIGSQLGRDKMGAIYVGAMEKLPRNPMFTDLALATYQTAVELYGAGSREAQVVEEAWTVTLELPADASLFTTPGSGR